MCVAVNPGAAFVADAHRAQWLARFAAYRGPAGSTSLKDGRSNGGAGAYPNRLTIHGDGKNLAQIRSLDVQQSPERMIEAIRLSAIIYTMVVLLSGRSIDAYI